VRKVSDFVVLHIGSKSVELESILAQPAVRSDIIV
jgi:hypothetical protein